MIDKKELMHLYNLARISYSEDELISMQSSMEGVIEIMDTVSTLDLSDVSQNLRDEITLSPLRHDEIEASLSTDLALANAPDCAAGLFKTKKVMED